MTTGDFPPDSGPEAVGRDQLIELASEQGNLDELRRLADQGNTTAREVLEELEE